MTTTSFLVLLLTLKIKKVLTIKAISSTLFPVCRYRFFVPFIMSILLDIGPTDMSDGIIFATSLSITVSLAVPLVLMMRFIAINKALEEILALLQAGHSRAILFYRGRHR